MFNAFSFILQEFKNVRHRNGTDYDCSALNERFTELGFEVEIFVDKEAREVMNILEEGIFFIECFYNFTFEMFNLLYFYFKNTFIFYYNYYFLFEHENMYLFICFKLLDHFLKMRYR